MCNKIRNTLLETPRDRIEYKEDPHVDFGDKMRMLFDEKNENEVVGILNIMDQHRIKVNIGNYACVLRDIGNQIYLFEGRKVHFHMMINYVMYSREMRNGISKVSFPL